METTSNLERVRDILENEKLLQSISVKEVMKNASEIYDVKPALATFKENVDRKYARD